MQNFREDAAGFRSFINEHQDRVYNIALKMLQHVQDAEEITQDVFIDVYRNPGLFRGESSVSTWLYRIAMNKCIDRLRKNEKRNRRFGGFFGTGNIPEDREPAYFMHPGVIAENREKTALLFKALKKLPSKQHMAWVLNEMEDMSYKEIGQVMNLSQSSIESLLVRARKNLRQLLDKSYPG